MEKREQDLINRLNAFEYDPDKNGLEVYEGELDTAVEISISLLSEFISQELDKAREEGYQDCMDDIWEEAKGLRSWTEHDGSVSSADIEAGLQEAYLNIENKLRQ